MADQVSDIGGGIASKAGGATGIPLGGLTGVLQGGVNNLINSGQGILDRWFPPEKREELKNKLMKFATERPQLAAFLLSQLALSGGPLALFFLMSLTVLVFALLAGVLVGVLGAVLFSVFCIGLALIILLPTLFVTTFAGCFIFLWGLGAYYIVKWFNQKDVPGIHDGGKGKMQKQLGLDNVPALNGQPTFGPDREKAKKEPPAEKKDSSVNGEAHVQEKEDEPPKSNSPAPAKNSQTSQGKGSGADRGAVGNVKKTAGGVASGVSSGLGL